MSSHKSSNGRVRKHMSRTSSDVDVVHSSRARYSKNSPMHGTRNNSSTSLLSSLSVLELSASDREDGAVDGVGRRFSRGSSRCNSTGSLSTIANFEFGRTGCGGESSGWGLRFSLPDEPSPSTMVSGGMRRRWPVAGDSAVAAGAYERQPRQPHPGPLVVLGTSSAETSGAPSAASGSGCGSGCGSGSGSGGSGSSGSGNGSSSGGSGDEGGYLGAASSGDSSRNVSGRNSSIMTLQRMPAHGASRVGAGAGKGRAAGGEAEGVERSSTDGSADADGGSDSSDTAMPPPPPLSQRYTAAFSSSAAPAVRPHAAGSRVPDSSLDELQRPGLEASGAARAGPSPQNAAGPSPLGKRHATSPLKPWTARMQHESSASPAAHSDDASRPAEAVASAAPLPPQVAAAAAASLEGDVVLEDAAAAAAAAEACAKQAADAEAAEAAASLALRSSVEAVMLRSPRRASTQSVPTAFEWHGACAAVCLCGSFNAWGERIPMRRSSAQKNDSWWAVLDLCPGEHAFKFVVQEEDGSMHWQHAPDQPTCIDAAGNTNNWVLVVDQLAYEREGGELPIAHLFRGGCAVSEPVADDPDADNEVYSQTVTEDELEILFAHDQPPPLPPHLAGESPAVGPSTRGVSYSLLGRVSFLSAARRISPPPPYTPPGRVEQRSPKSMPPFATLPPKMDVGEQTSGAMTSTSSSDASGSETVGDGGSEGGEAMQVELDGGNEMGDVSDDTEAGDDEARRIEAGEADLPSVVCVTTRIRTKFVTTELIRNR